ncbi:MAG: hypothetical protein RBS80_16420 [Thermoguttaceae bacterium]|jgi:hypothetical protein|nr:hypothetical protein [Thermoguttaceae bacterium]
MKTPSYRLAPVFLLGAILAPGFSAAQPPAKRVVRDDALLGENLIQTANLCPYEQGFTRDGDVLLCDNGADADVLRGIAATVTLDQSEPMPVLAICESKAEGVAGSRNNDYSLYLDIRFADGTYLYGQAASFPTGTRDWQSQRVLVVPEKPISSISYYMLFRRHVGKAWFRNPRLYELKSDGAIVRFDHVAVEQAAEPAEGFLVRDAAADSDFVPFTENAVLGLALDVKTSEADGAVFFDVELADTTGRDRAVTLVYGFPVPKAGLHWFNDPRRSEPVAPRREYSETVHYASVGANGRLSQYPLGAVGGDSTGTALAIDMRRPAFYRIGYNAGSQELYIAYDIGLTPEKPSARVRFCRFPFDPQWGFRAALAKYKELFPESFRVRIERQGMWMPFAKISEVKGFEDFGFVFKEGDNETAFDDAHDIYTFRYVEPTTWWMRMDPSLPRTIEAAEAEARRLAEGGNRAAMAWKVSAFHDADGRPTARLLDTPWCNGAVWSINTMPGIPGEVTGFNLHWNQAYRESRYGPNRRDNLDGEYFDSCSGYVTAELDYRREHFAAAKTPLCFSIDERRPAIFKGLIMFEQIELVADELHAMGRLTMGNAVPGPFCWLAGLIDVMGTETDWHRNGRWQPMPDWQMIYRRALAGGKPYCFLMNTVFEDLNEDLVERYMKRSLAYGMFPGFFSHNASEGQFFQRPELYNRYRPLFQRYVPLCRRVAEAGWQPVSLARSDNSRVYVERFGDRYLTVFNDSDSQQQVTVQLDGLEPGRSIELLTGREIAWNHGRATFSLAAEDVAVIDVGAE